MNAMEHSKCNFNNLFGELFDYNPCILDWSDFIKSGQIVTLFFNHELMNMFSGSCKENLE